MQNEDVGSREAFGMLALVISLIAVIGAVVGIGLGARAIDEADDRVAVAAAGPVSVSLTEYAITPSVIEASPGTELTVTNDGTIDHNLAVKGEDATTPMLAAGDSSELDLGGLAEGTYDVICTVPGHAELGMEASLHVGASGASGQAGQAAAHSSSEMTPEEMDAAAAERASQFPAETEGLGAQLLEPEVLPDGTKVFDLTAEVFEWEVEPGKVVEAWGYNGTIPGPTLRVDGGDRVRINLTNELEESTSLHLHGIDIPNEMDGVPDVTQPQITSGESYTYEFVAEERAVGMYHAHSNSQVQVPMGLAGALIIGDLPVPEGRTAPTQEIPFVLHDAGEIGFGINGKSFPATTPITAKVGETILLHYFNEGFQIHPMHLHGPRQTVIAKDGVPLEVPYTGDTINVAPGERYSVLVTPNRPGVWVFHCHILTHAEAPNGFIGMTTALIVEP